ncbi:rap guanine nucleotide exchange factor 5 isoform X1 [Ahaetulla prasina]|uniref:rap guanine nucleotide exchange factor 5 isoform X1 n=3 Tax=Ahaetulla prasina TaxID=499056 RepID=UPI0026473551|nr:rap guanine nucleotide exchange factor 5 isoform X1 [Ahaetulla prasina]
MAGSSLKMQPACDRADSLLHDRNATDARGQEQQVQLRQKLRELPTLLRSGLTLRRKRSDGGGRIVSRRISNPYVENPPNKIYGEDALCAGRALRNFFLLQASALIKDRMSLMGLCRQSCIGSELVDWLLKCCTFINSRSTAAGIWQLLLNMGIVFTVDKQTCFLDRYVFYQFSSDECTYLFCEYEGEKGWKNGVKFLLKMVPATSPSMNTCKLDNRRIEETAESNAEILARLTAAMQRELATVLAMKARKSAMNQSYDICSGEATVQKTPKDICDAQAGVMCKLQEREDAGHIELVQKFAKENCHVPQTNKREPGNTDQPDDEVTTVQVKELNQDVLVLRRVLSQSPTPTSGSAENDWRYVVVSGTPEKILEHLLNDLHLEEVQDKDTETLLDDFLLTYTVFMTTDDLCQALLKHYCAKNHQDKGEIVDVPCRKRKVLHLVSQWTSLYKDWLHEDEHLKQFLKTIYRNVLDDVYEYPILEKDLKEFQKLLGMHRRHTVDEYSPHRKHKAILHQYSLKQNWLQTRESVNETEEVFCRVYITQHSYISIKTKLSTSVQEILKIVAEKLQHSQEDLALVALSFSDEKHELRPYDLAISKSLELSARMFVFRKDLTDTLIPFTENEEIHQRSMKILGINTWDLALELTVFDWNLFNLVHEQELIYFTFSRQGNGKNTVNLSLLLQRCNEVQLWVATEILLCNQLCKRVQLVKKFIKIAAHCKAQRNLNSFFAIVMGLNTASISRLSQTWERMPGKFKKLFAELESLTDPSLNHKAYRDAFKKMKSPKIPFMPLLLKDVTFIHEGNKTFLDNLVNFEKLHMIADTVRSLRHCRRNQFGNDIPSKEHEELKSYVHHLHIIDNQQMLFELSHRIEPRI